MIDLSKADRKAAREIIEKGLQREFADGLNRSYQILEDWKSDRKNADDTYHALYAYIEKFDRNIAKRYDNMSGSNYLFIIAAQVVDGIVDETELKNLSPEAREFVNRILSLNR